MLRGYSQFVNQGTMLMIEHRTPTSKVCSPDLLTMKPAPKYNFKAYSQETLKVSFDHLGILYLINSNSLPC